MGIASQRNAAFETAAFSHWKNYSLEYIEEEELNSVEYKNNSPILKEIEFIKMQDSTENAKNRCLKMKATAPNMINAFEGFHEYRLRTTIAHDQIFGHFHFVLCIKHNYPFFSSSLVHSSALREMNRQPEFDPRNRGTVSL